METSGSLFAGGEYVKGTLKDLGDVVPVLQLLKVFPESVHPVRPEEMLVRSAAQLLLSGVAVKEAMVLAVAVLDDEQDVPVAAIVHPMPAMDELTAFAPATLLTLLAEIVSPTRIVMDTADEVVAVLVLS